jgi:hypothetical protein
LHDLNDALIDATISINEDGSGIVEIAGKKMRFPWVTLLSSDADERLVQLDQFLRQYPLSDGDAASLRARVARPDFSDDDFWAAAGLFESSPEAFAERLADKVRREEGESLIAPVDVLPCDDRYWNRLLPPEAGSMTLRDYIGQELNAAWRDGLEADPVRALHGSAITFAAPELQRRPVFWRRVAGTAHASLIVRVFGGNGIDPDGIISWAMRLFGDACYLSVVSDFAVEPQWRPEWIVPKILVADLFGRAFGAWSRLSQEAAPTSWKERIDKAHAWIVAEKSGPSRSTHPFSKEAAECIGRSLPNFGASPRSPMHLWLWRTTQLLAP